MVFAAFSAAPVYAFQLRHVEPPMIFPAEPRYPARPTEDNLRHGLMPPPMGQDRAREAMQQGEILPLSNIRRRVRDQFGGKIVGVDLGQASVDGFSPGPWIYDIRVLSPEGRVLSIEMDASDGRVLGVRGQR